MKGKIVVTPADDRSILKLSINYVCFNDNWKSGNLQQLFYHKELTKVKYHIANDYQTV